MTLRAHFYSRRNRNLAALAAVALVSVVLAFFALHHRQSVMAPKYEPQTLFPGLAHALNAGDVTRIHIASKKGEFDVVFLPSRGWVLPDRGKYPADFEVVKETLVAIAAMRTVEPKTDRPDLFHFVGLDAPPQGDGVAITLTDDDKKVVAALIVGKPEMVGGSTGLFVRKAGENQSWLVTSPAEIKSAIGDWMRKAVVSFEQADVASVEVQPSEGPSYTASRTKPEDANFTLAPLPKGRELAYPGAADMSAAALTDFTFDDVRQDTDMTAGEEARIVVHGFDGLTVTLQGTKDSDGVWVRLDAEAAPGKPAAAKAALAINARAAGWAFRLPAFKASSFAPALETLLKPKAK